MGDSQPFVTISEWQPTDGHSFSSGDSAYGSSIDDERTPSATHDISRVNYHIKHLPEFAKTLEDSATRAFPNRGGSQRYKQVHALLLHWTCDDLFVLKELDDLEACFREEYNFQTETFPIPSDNAHLELMLKVGAMIKEHESSDTLFIVYYGGHARIDESRQSTWCGTRSSDSPWLQWSAIQTLLERSLSDVLILLDCCAGAASATFPNGNSITETISASSWDANAPDPGRYSFTNTLIEVLQEWKRRTYSAAMLHAEVLARLKHPRPEMLNGKHFEARATPVHFMMTANHKAPSIEIARISPPDMRPPSPPQDPGFEAQAPNGRSAGPQDIAGSEPNEDVPHVMISLALEEDQRLNINDWENWLSSIPALAKYVKVQGVFKSHSTLLLLSMPVMVWDLLPENHACNFIAFIRSNNLAARGHAEQRPLEEEAATSADKDADSSSIYSGTTAYTSRPMEPGRLSIMSALSNDRSPIGLAHGRFESTMVDMRNHRSTAKSSKASPHGPLGRQRTAPGGFLHKSMSHNNIAQQLTTSQSRDKRRTSLASIASQSELPPQVQARLEEYFQDNPTPAQPVKEFLASTNNIETADIELWFQNRRAQQDLENRLQSLKIDDHSHDAPKDGAQMILPGHLNRLLEIFSTGQITIIDLRSPSEYENSHIHGAINFRAPASFVARATVETIAKALPDERSRDSFNKWCSSRCVVFYDKVVEFPWEAPVADALLQKFKEKGWMGQCFVLKGHYREFSHSFDKYIVGKNTTSNAKEYLASLQDTSRELPKDAHQQYEDWLELLEGDDRVHVIDLVPAVKAERVEATVRHQKEIEDEFEKRQPELYREAMDRQPEENWAVKGPMVAHLERGIVKMQEAGKVVGMGRSAAPPSDYKRAADKLSMSDYDLLESEDEHLSHNAMPPKMGSGSVPAPAPTPAPKPASNDTVHGKGGRSGGRGFLTKMLRSSRPDTP